MSHCGRDCCVTCTPFQFGRERRPKQMAISGCKAMILTLYPNSLVNCEFFLYLEYKQLICLIVSNRLYSNQCRSLTHEVRKSNSICNLLYIIPCASEEGCVF